MTTKPGLSPAVAHAIGWMAIGLEASALLMRKGGARLGVRLIAAVWNLGQATALGLLTAAAIALAYGLAPRRAWARLSAGFIVAFGVGLLLLSDDLRGAAGRFGERWMLLVRTAAIAVVAAGVPIAALVGRLLGRHRILRFLGVFLGASLGAAHASYLAGLYPGLHAYAAWIGAALLGGALTGAELEDQSARLALRYRAAAYVLVAELAGFAMLLAPPSAALVQLVWFPGAVAAPYAALIYPPPRRRHDTALDPEWFQNRSNHPAIPATPVKLLPPNGIVVLFTAECLRADLLGYPQIADRLPNLHRLARTGIQFTNARSPSPATGPTIAAIFSGRYYSQLYWTETGSGERVTVFTREDPTPRFPSHLRDAGIDTVNLVGQRAMASHWGLVGGFSEEPRVPQRGRCESLIDSAIQRLEKQPENRRLFLYGHFKEGHDPYKGAGKSDWERYISDLSRADAQLGRLLDVIDQPKYAGRTALFLTADHGEAFGEHGLRYHGTSMYDELLRVTFLARLPGVPSRREDRPVSSIDLGPTILDLFGLPTPGHHMGQSLVTYLLGRPGTLARPIVGDSGRRMQSMVFEDGIKVIFDKRLGTVELYDLARDPAENDTLTDQRPELRDERLSMLHAFFEAHELRREGYTIPFRP